MLRLDGIKRARWNRLRPLELSRLLFFYPFHPSHNLVSFSFFCILLFILTQSHTTTYTTAFPVKSLYPFLSNHYWLAAKRPTLSKTNITTLFDRLLTLQCQINEQGHWQTKAVLAMTLDKNCQCPFTQTMLETRCSLLSWKRYSSWVISPVHPKNLPMWLWSTNTQHWGKYML